MIRVLSNIESVQSSKASFECLQDFALFRSLPKTKKLRVARQTRWVSVSEGFTVIEAFEPINHVYFLVSGKVAMMNAVDEGIRLQMGIVNPGQFFGELSAIDGAWNATSAIALSDCVLGVLESDVFVKLVTQYEQAAALLQAKLVERIRYSEDRIVVFSRTTADQRVCLELIQYLEPDPGNSTKHRIFPVPTQVEIAETIGTTRQTVARVFGRLSRDEIIERRGRVLLVHDYKKLEAIASLQKVA